MLSFGIVSAVILVLLIAGCLILGLVDSVGAILGILIFVMLGPAAVYNGMTLFGAAPQALGIVGIVLMSIVMLVVSIFGLVVAIAEEEGRIFLACLVPVLLAVVPLVYISMSL